MITVLQADLSNLKHAQAIIQLMNEYAQDPMGGGKPLSDYCQENLVTALQQQQGFTAILAYDGENAVGLLNAIEGFSTFSCAPLLNIHDVIVSNGYRGRGVARRLFELIEQLAHQQGCCKLTLEVLEGNVAAKTAYQSFGFDGYELDPNMGKALFWEKKVT